jgi:hypothetical protein
VIPARSSAHLLLLSCGHPGRRQAETPLIPLSRFPEPALGVTLSAYIGLLSIGSKNTILNYGKAILLWQRLVCLARFLLKKKRIQL